MYKTSLQLLWFSVLPHILFTDLSVAPETSLTHCFRSKNVLYFLISSIAEEGKTESWTTLYDINISHPYSFDFVSGGCTPNLLLLILICLIRDYMELRIIICVNFIKN